MTNTSDPIPFNLSLLGGLAKVFIDSKSAVKILKISSSGSYAQATLPDGSNYGAVPATTTLKIYGLESLSSSHSGGPISDAYLGYADDATGTNFVKTFDVFGSGLLDDTTHNNIFVTMDIPTGKYLVARVVTSYTASLTIKLIGLEV